MKTKVLFLGLAIASLTTVSAQTFNKANYAFEIGKIPANSSNKSSCNWWIQNNDVFSITDSKNHTPNGKHSLYFKTEAALEKQKMACASFNPDGMVELKDGEYTVSCWVFVESGKIKNFSMIFPATKYKDGKKLAPKSKESADFESPYFSAMIQTAKVPAGTCGRRVLCDRSFTSGYAGADLVELVNVDERKTIEIQGQMMNQYFRYFGI